jgi:outer membrane protein
MLKGNKFLLGFNGLILVGLVVLYFIVFTKSERVAYIDTSKLLEKSKDMQSAKAKLKVELDKMKADVDTLANEFQESLKAYEKNQAKMSSKERELSKQLLTTRQNQMLQYQQSIKQKAAEEEQKKTQEVLNKINGFIIQYGEDNNYKLIFATSQGNIAYGDKGVDITEEIIAGINN